MADNRVTEKEQLKASSQTEGGDLKAVLSQEAFDNAVKHAQSAGSSIKDTHASEQAKGSTAESLPNIILHNGSDSNSKIGAEQVKQGGSDMLNHKIDAKDSNDLHDISKTKMLESLGKALKEGDLTKEQFNQKMIDFVSQKDGVQKLATGDYIVKEDGKQTLFTPNGDHITINPDGTSSVKGDIAKVSTDKDGLTTVQFGDGASATFDKEGFHDVSRGNQSVSLLNGGILEFPNRGTEPDPYHFPHSWPKPEYDPPTTDPLRFKPVMDWNHRIDDLKKYSPDQTENLKARD